MNNSIAANLIKAIQIFDKYMEDGQYFTHCEHDILMIAIDDEKVSEEDEAELIKLGFRKDHDGGFTSYKYGSC